MYIAIKFDSGAGCTQRESIIILPKAVWSFAIHRHLIMSSLLQFVMHQRPFYPSAENLIDLECASSLFTI